MNENLQKPTTLFKTYEDSQNAVDFLVKVVLNYPNCVCPTAYELIRLLATETAKLKEIKGK